MGILHSFGQRLRRMQRIMGLRFSAEGTIALTRGFAVAGSLAIGAFSVGMGLVLSQQLETRLLERDAAVSRDFVQSIVRIQQAEALLEGSLQSQSSAPMEFFSHLAAMPDVLRANVYSPTGRVLWSSQPELLGRTFAANPELDRALTGRVVVNLEHEDHEHHPHALKAEHHDLAESRIPFVESYLPIYAGQKATPVAVVELYRQPVALIEAIEDAQRRVMAGALGGGLALFILLILFVRRTERALNDRQRRLLEAETLGVVGEISAAVAHSIRNPLGSIRSTAELQIEVAGDPQGVHADTIHHVDRIEHLVRTMLTCASGSTERQGPADLSEVLRATARSFEPDLKQQGVGLNLELPAQLGAVRADPVLLQQVFNSLLANAAEAVRQGGRIELLARKVGRMALVEVMDTGHGIPSEKLREIFKPFYTTKARGLGLGLPLARRIVRRVGGELRIDSRPGQGTCVQVEFPLEGSWLKT